MFETILENECRNKSSARSRVHESSMFAIFVLCKHSIVVWKLVASRTAGNMLIQCFIIIPYGTCNGDIKLDGGVWMNEGIRPGRSDRHRSSY